MKIKYLTQNPTQTKKMGRMLAKEILTPHHYIGGGQKHALLLGLEGDLGGGKTTFLQGFAKGLGVKQRITSPTFVLIKRYQIPDTKYQIQDFYHIDCYRIEKPKEILDLDFKEIIENPKNIVAIEWADRIKKILPKDAISLKFEFIDKNKRKVSIWRKSI